MKLWIQEQPDGKLGFMLSGEADQLVAHPPAPPIVHVRAFLGFADPPAQGISTVRLCPRCPDYPAARLWARLHYRIELRFCPHCALAELKALHENT